MEKKDFAILALQLSAPVATYLIGWITGRRKHLAETESAELANIERAIGIYRKLTEDLEKEMADLKHELTEVRRQNEELMRKLDQANKENLELKKQIESLEIKISNLKNSIQ